MDEHDLEPTPSTSTARTPTSLLSTPAKAALGSPNAGSAGRGTPLKGTPLRPVEDAAGESDDEEDEGPSLETMKAFGRQVQRAPQTAGSSTGPAKVVIPKRGEKDFEPLNQTVTIQEKMLRESRQALFDGLSGVRGTSSKNISHATLSSQSTFPQVQLVRGNLFLTMGHTIRPAYIPSEKGKSKATDPTTNISTMELLPEEALYLLERGSMQIWCAPSAYGSGAVEPEGDVGFTWDEEIQGFKGMVEMTAMEGFSRFIGQQGLTLERYQVYAGLKRLGYTVHRTPRFLPRRFRKPAQIAQSAGQTTRSFSVAAVATRLETSVRAGIVSVFRKLWFPFRWVLQRLMGMVVRVRGGRGGVDSQSLLGRITATGYGALYEKLRIIPSGHSHPVTVPTSSAENDEAQMVEGVDVDPFESLGENPYLPFFHVWKPNTHWTRGKWDRGSSEGLKTLPPDFWIAVVDARSVPFPTLPQMEEIFPTLPALPTPTLRPRGTPSGPTAKPNATATTTNQPKTLVASASLFNKLSGLWRSISWSKAKALTPQVNTFLALKQGDRSLIVAVVDGGNVGWTRLGRGGFQEHIMVPNEML